MLKLVYDLKAGFEDCYLTIKNEVYDFSYLCEHGEESTDPDFEPRVNIDPEEEIYNDYKYRLSSLMEFLDNSGDLDSLKRNSVSRISKLFFSHMLKGNELPIWEASNFRLEYDPEVRSQRFYDEALSASEVCSWLKLTRQQLHYYVKTGAVRKEYNPENNKQFKYNYIDVYILQKKLEKKYDRYK